MTTYTATFRTDTAFATENIEADTPELALQLALGKVEDDRHNFWFERYTDMSPINEIAIGTDDADDLAVWRDEDMHLRLGARDLLNAAECVIERWEQGDLAEAVRELTNAVRAAKGGAA